jgi:uncharacterized protein YbbC (DUF1343 family)
MMPPQVRTGLDSLAANGVARLRGLRLGLVTHPAAVDCQLRHAASILANTPEAKLAALFGPEHGLWGEAQDLVSVASGPADRIPTHSLYGMSVDSLRPTAEQLANLDALVIDLQDIGSRYYTFQATMLYCMEEASRHGLLTVILDRPNPLGGVAMEGPLLKAGYQSFVGPHPIVTRHGMTMGELAWMYHAERQLAGELVVVPCEGWRREMLFKQTGLPWVLPSPNMPTLDTAFVYPGQCLLEGTNLSEGRGTTRPFEICGAPWIDAQRLSFQLNAEELPGVIFRPVWFQPTFHKFAGQRCGGVQLHVTDREVFQPVRTGLAVLATIRDMCAGGFMWRVGTYEFVSDRLAIDLLFGSRRERDALEAGKLWRDIAADWEAEEAAFLQRRKPYLIYDN